MSDTDQCAREVTWGDQKYLLNLNNKWVRSVLSYRGINGKPPAAILLGFETGAYSIDEVETIIGLGLIGGGMPERDADKLLDAHVRTAPVAENAGTAAALLAALYIGTP